MQDNRRSVSFRVEPHPMSKVKKVIAVVSGKGGVGKTLISSLLAVFMSQRGYQVAILDADITGPSIPKAFGLETQAQATETGILPIESRTGIKIMSMNLLLENTTDPVVWRGPMIASAIKQFWSEVMWGEVDYMFIDLPPGTGDVPLTIFQSLPVDGIVIVTSPQELVSMIVAKAVKMAQLMQVPILGLVENMAYIKCPDCGCAIQLFGESHIHQIAEEFGIDALAQLPIEPSLAKAVDRGEIENISGDWLNPVTDNLEMLHGV